MKSEEARAEGLVVRSLKYSAVRPDIAGLADYVPVEPIERQSERLGLRVEEIAKLDGNENPYGPSPRVAEAVARTAFQLYPDPLHLAPREAVAEYVGAPADRILFGNGSDELLELLVRLLLEPGDEVITCEPSFGMYTFLPPLFLGKVLSVPRRQDFSVDPGAILGALTPRTKLIILASPNNPTGNLLPQADLRLLLDSGRCVVVDEAYVEFAQVPLPEPDPGSGLESRTAAGNPRARGTTSSQPSDRANATEIDDRPCPSAIPLSEQYDNLVVLRTFSKWAGLAGLRAGYGVFPAELMRHLWKIKQPYNLNVAAAAAVLASLEDRRWLLGNVRKIVRERERLAGLLRRLPGWTVFPSDANFLLCQVAPAQEVKDRLWQRGIMVRGYFQTSGLESCLRISVGLPEHSDRIMAALR